MLIESLKIFCDLVESGSFSRAASSNFVSQSAVSQQIKKVEETFGHKLVERGKRGLNLTPAGEIFYKGCKDMVQRYDEMESALQELSGVVAGTIKVEAIYSVGIHELSSYLKTFFSKYPQVNVILDYDRADQIYENVINNKIDLGIVVYPVRKGGIETIPFKEDELVVISNPDHPLSRFDKLDVEMLQGQRFVAFEKDTPTRRAIDKILKDHKVQVEISMEIDNVEMLKHAVEADLGVSIVPSVTVEQEIEHGTLKAIDFKDKRFKRPLGIIHKRGKVLTVPAERFIQTLTRQGENKGDQEDRASER